MIKNSQEFKELYDRWYLKPYILWLIIQDLKNKEVAWNAQSKKKEEYTFHKRNNTIGKIETLKKILFHDNYYVTDLFGTIAEYSLWQLHRNKPTASHKEKYFNKAPEITKRVVFDIDSKNMYIAVRDTQRLTWKLQREGIKYYVVFSGKKGFHIITNTYFSAKKYEETANNILKDRKDAVLYLGVKDAWRRYCKNIVKSARVNADMAIYSTRREWRTEYSLHGSTGLICFPLSQEQWNEVRQKPDNVYDVCDPNKLLRTTKLINRTVGWYD